MKTMISSALVAAFITLCGMIGYHAFFSAKIAYVDTARLMVGFSEASKIENELKAEDDKWRLQLKVLEDSLQATVNLMTKEYDNATAARKKELQDILSANNQKMNNFTQANLRNMAKLKTEKMEAITKKINVYLDEYGKKKGYSIILGTTNGNILYGERNKYDVTDELINELNRRYK